MSRQRFALGDAARGHLEVRVVDHSVSLRSIQVRDLLGAPLNAGLIEAQLVTPETASLYSSQTERPSLVEVDVELRFRGHVVATLVTFISLAILATGAALVVPADANTATKLGVLAIPVTVTSALLLVREQSALAARMQTWPRLLVLGVTALLWVAVLARLLG